ncbi:MAG TPA: 16S rRNA (guanine(966)-N(2))-methyltransferase RsmD [Thermopetrobacter sp.]|nr:16S rRNA (guanine(966)-N(2))-methyltransferase RsmD [Thermopetrobacter sp.]
MRIIAGTFRGRRIVAPAGRDTRPTTDRVREAIFNVLAHAAWAPALAGARVLDLFAGSGAMGLEAASRGAAFVLFMETDAAARAAIRRNIEELGLSARTRLWRRDATRPGHVASMPPFDLAFLDPPWGRGLAGRALAALRGGGWLSPGAVTVLEESARSDFAVPQGYVLRDVREHGDARVHFLQALPLLST